MADSLTSKTKLDHLVDGIMRDVCELPDYNSPDDNPELLQATCSQLEAILRNRLGDEKGITKVAPHGVVMSEAPSKDERTFPSQLRIETVVIADLIETSPLRIRLHKAILAESDVRALRIWLERVLLYKPDALPDGLVKFADKRFGCPVCGNYADEKGLVAHNPWMHDK